MILIADSGSTKTEWILLDKGSIASSFLTSGFNPYYFAKEEIQQILANELPNDLPVHEISKVIYYGSGCSTLANCLIVSTAFETVFGATEILIHHDLLAAAHALLGKEAGIACILGTGSNSCYYDGSQIIENVPSLGYMLGDEGSANHIGRKLLTAVLSGNAPQPLINKFYSSYALSFESAMRELYSTAKPGLFLAGFSSFVGEHLDEEFCRDLVANAFDDFISAQLSKYSFYKKVPVSFTGSVAWHSREILQQRLQTQGILLGKVMRTPIKGLAAYYADQS
jgi:glucosamine kinase